MINLKSWTRILALTALTLLPVSSGFAQDFVDLNSAERMMQLDAIQLRAQLQSGLRLTSRAQNDYLNVIISAVESGQIPRAMVNVVFVWAIKRNPKYPFPYFQAALRILASRRGIQLP